MCRLFPCIPVFEGFLLKNGSMRDILRKHIDTLFLMCFNGQKEVYVKHFHQGAAIIPTTITEVKVLGEYLCSVLFETTLYLLAITINTIPRGTILMLSNNRFLPEF